MKSEKNKMTQEKKEKRDCLIITKNEEGVLSLVSTHFLTRKEAGFVLLSHALNTVYVEEAWIVSKD